jgi:hypothetical protein
MCECRRRHSLAAPTDAHAAFSLPHPQTPAGWDFGKTQTDFVTLLSPGVLNGTHRWLTRARLWRLILSQSTEGWWDASPNTAFVLESRAATETEHLPTTLFSRVLIILGGIVEVAATSDTDLAGGDERRNDATSALDDVLSSGDQARATGTKEDVDESLSPENATNTPPTASLRRNESMARAAGITDCPLTCSVSAITAAMPRRLSALRAADASIAVTRVWTTMCCISILERMNHNWIWGDGCVLLLRVCELCVRVLAHAECVSSIAAPLLVLRRSDLYPEQERTIVDGALAAPRRLRQAALRVTHVR